jgi:multicomponent Na+:H+ antiporter subunit D
VFLSAFTTKTAVYVLLRGFPGTEILIWVGIFMIFYGIVYALLENDMRRILAYSIVNQVGFMITGIGIGTEMALNGAAAHAFTHIIYKALLLMSAGAVLADRPAQVQRAGRAVPQHAADHDLRHHRRAGDLVVPADLRFRLQVDGHAGRHRRPPADVWLFLAAASAGVFLHAGIKFPWFVFFQKDSGLRPADPPSRTSTPITAPRASSPGAVPPAAWCSGWR